MSSIFEFGITSRPISRKDPTEKLSVHSGRKQNEYDSINRIFVTGRDNRSHQPV